MPARSEKNSSEFAFHDCTYMQAAKRSFLNLSILVVIIYERSSVPPQIALAGVRGEKIKTAFQPSRPIYRAQLICVRRGTGSVLAASSLGLFVKAPTFDACIMCVLEHRPRKKCHYPRPR